MPRLRLRWAKIVVFVACLVPLAYLIWRAREGRLTANPIEFITHFTGDWTIRLIVATLAVTPLRKALAMPGLIRYRRMLGLFAFFYGCLHFLTYVYLDKFFAWEQITKDVAKRPFITAGFASFVLMLPLAATSTAGWIRRLGGKNWRALHRLIYFSGVAAAVHYYWLVKSDVRLPLFYGSLVAILLAYRAANRALDRRRKPALVYGRAASTASERELS